MSFRGRASEVREKGKANRKNITLKGVPKKVYEYWLHNSESLRASRTLYGSRTENFCHAFWVVVFFAPSLFLFTKAADAVENPFVQIALGALAVGVLIAASILSDHFFIGLLLVLGGALALAGLIVSIVFVVENYPESWKPLTGKITFGIFAAVVLAAAIWLVTLLALEIHWWLLLAVVGAALVIGAGWVGAVLLSDYLDGREEYIAEKRQEYYDEHGEFPPGKEAGKFKKFFLGLGDFLVLAGQFIRVKKWKFCPTVQVDTEARV